MVKSINKGKGWLQEHPGDSPITIKLKEHIQDLFNKGEDQKAVDLAIKAGLLKKEGVRNMRIEEKIDKYLNESGSYEENGLKGRGDEEPTCPKCGNANAMLHSYKDEEKAGIKRPDQGIGYKCRDCGYVHIWKKQQYHKKID